MRAHLTIVGGGLGGLVGAIAAREAGMDVTLYEASKELGGRARTTPGPHRANWGPHVIYDDGPLWAWLDRRGLARPARRAPITPRVLLRIDGRARRVPPRRVLRALLRLRSASAPVDRSFRDWASDRLGDAEAAQHIANLMGVVTFDHDPGRLSAAFVQERLRRVTQLPPAARYIPGGWATLVDRLAGRAGDMGVRIEMDSPVDEMPPAPVILAVPLARAAHLLGSSLAWTGTRTALLDLAVTSKRRDPFVVVDLDAPGWVETYSFADPSLAPAEQHLVQSQTGLRPGETLGQGVARLEALMDTAYEGWRERETWRRRLRVHDESGALDLPGSTWRDRPTGRIADGIHLVGDMVAAPGILSEVTYNSAVDAVERLVANRPLVRVA